MATFEDARSELRSLAAAITSELGYNAVDDITVPEPSGPTDELYFRKLVSWSYVALVEVFPVALKQLTNLLRSCDSSGHARLSRTKDAVNVLRTVQSHNMGKQSASNERQKASADTWMVTNAGTPFSWEVCCSALCAQIHDVFATLRAIWAKVTESDEDRAGFINNLKAAFDTDWPAYAFDTAVKDAADAIGLEGFDVVAYRNSHIDAWRKLAGLFRDRQSATEAVGRAISVELRATFGIS